MTCKHCGSPVRPCPVRRCHGWATAGFCGGWMHQDLFHGCRDGRHQAEPSVKVYLDNQPQVEGSGA